MKEEKNNLITEAVEYLNFIKRYRSFPLFNDGLLVEDILKKLESIQNSIQNDQSLYTAPKSEKINQVSDTAHNGKDEIIKEMKKGTSKNVETKFADEKELIIVNESPKYKDINEINLIVSNCTKCSILSEQRNKVVFGSGDKNADLVIVGEAPGAEEDRQGLPFVGRAGKLLTEILKAINFTREEVYICNILKCRPPENRNPMPDEIANCEPYLFSQLKLIKPKLILALGTFASQTLLRSNKPLGKLRGRFHTYEGIKMMVTYHPAALLRNPNWKKPTWEDVKMLRAEYDRMK